jgi:hypothetical protein
MPNTIILRGDPMRKERPLKASVDITPGMLCEYDTVYIKPHATDGGNASPIFAVENAIHGDGIDTDYSNDLDTVLFCVAERGDEIYALVATGNNVSNNALLCSNGDGALKIYTAPSQAVNEGGSATYTIAPKVLAPVARALEAVNNTSGSNARIKVEVL